MRQLGSRVDGRRLASARVAAKSVGRKSIAPILGRKRLQPLFEALYELSLAGLNFGEGNHPKLSGEELVIRLIAAGSRLEPRRPVLFDVGANTGVYTKALLEVFGASATIWAFEPAPSTYSMLESAVGDRDTVRLVNVGLSDVAGGATLHSVGPGSKLASVYDTGERLSRPGFSVPVEEQVKLTTIDRFCAQKAIEWIDFMKLDVEGHELKVLEGAAGLLDHRRIDAIQFEFSAANLESRTYFRDFFELLTPGYSIYRVLQDGIYPIERYKEAYEVFKRATNYLALRQESRVKPTLA
ncbi:MAG: FkbM family methyltransferase [Actinobacteria bacterium]|nr:FkbM family methyltransferase [Actinomycetota bacterium]